MGSWAERLVLKIEVFMAWALDLQRYRISGLGDSFYFNTSHNVNVSR